MEGFIPKMSCFRCSWQEMLEVVTEMHWLGNGQEEMLYRVEANLLLNNDLLCEGCWNFGTRRSVKHCIAECWPPPRSHPVLKPKHLSPAAPHMHERPRLETVVRKFHASCRKHTIWGTVRRKCCIGWRLTCCEIMICFVTGAEISAPVEV